MLALAVEMVMEVVAVVSIDRQPTRSVFEGINRVLSIPPVPPMSLITAFVTYRLPTMPRTDQSRRNASSAIPPLI